MIYPGGCFCEQVRYEINLKSPDDARMSICHCKNCKKFTGSECGITAKIPRSTFRLTRGEIKKHQKDNGSGTLLTREFCGTCGSGIAEYGANAGDNTYIFYGSLDVPDELPPKVEYFCKYRATWMPAVPGLPQKREVKE
jgi:hypothetical protein